MLQKLQRNSTFPLDWKSFPYNRAPCRPPKRCLPSFTGFFFFLLRDWPTWRRRKGDRRKAAARTSCRMTPFIGGSLVFLSLLFFCVSFAAKPFGGGVLLLLFRRLLLFCSCSCPCSCSCASRHSGSRSCLVVRFLFFLHRPLLLSIPRVHRPRSSNFLGFALPMLCCSYNFASGAVADEDISRRIRSHCYGYCGRRRCFDFLFVYRCHRWRSS